ncbi:Zinc finger CCHC-type [Arabidopsis thaliana x Arabidopsis arenosa]|uniref:Zinc finger CCHC-type n=1 Tax=Arabidopsis thaliana x Arabidopsis arenosa TaxID=1240361 RepID=A0A8T1XMD8_9BRAS|nr:Zinc finger CCHC-type [Arabidopsis thaliana x Arabidopsis arenosa]
MALHEFLSYGPQKDGTNVKPMLRKTKDGKIFEWKVEKDAPLCTLEEAFVKVKRSLGFNIELKFDDNIGYGEEELRQTLDNILKVFFLTNGGCEIYKDVRRNSLDEAIKLCKESGLQGIVSKVKAILRTPNAITRVKDSKLSLLSYGQLNNVVEVIYLQYLMGVEGVIVDMVKDISEAITNIEVTNYCEDDDGRKCLISSDHAGLILVSDRLTTGADFHSWRRFVRMALNQRSHVTKFLMGLNESYESTRRHILMLKPIPTIEDAFNMVTQDERQRSIKPPTSEPVVFQTSGPNQASGSSNHYSQDVSSYQGQLDNTAFAIHNGYRPRAPRPICTHCGQSGHVIQKCFKLHGYPPGYIPGFKSTFSNYQPQRSSAPSNFQPRGYSPNTVSRPHSVANVITSPIPYTPPSAIDAMNLDISKLNGDQIQTLIQQLSSHIQISKPLAPSPSTSKVTEHGIMAVQSSSASSNSEIFSDTILPLPIHLHNDLQDNMHASSSQPSLPNDHSAASSALPSSLTHSSVTPISQETVTTETDVVSLPVARPKRTKPKTFKQAIVFVQWTKAMEVELEAMELNKTWSVVSLPPGKNIVGCKWVYTIKYNPDGTVESELDEEIYMSLPQGYTPVSGSLPPNTVCKLHKSIYGLKQASRQWLQGTSFIAILVYVDDILIVRLLGCKPRSVPMDPKVSLTTETGTLLENATPYRELIGRLLYLCVTRPDITFAVHKLSHFLSCATNVHMHAAQNVLKYLKGNPGQGLFYSAKTDICLNGFADADWEHVWIQDAQYLEFVSSLELL